MDKIQTSAELECVLCDITQMRDLLDLALIRIEDRPTADELIDRQNDWQAILFTKQAHYLQTLIEVIFEKLKPTYDIIEKAVAEIDKL